jgi:hypothetical protein
LSAQVYRYTYLHIPFDTLYLNVRSSIQHGRRELVHTTAREDILIQILTRHTNIDAFITINRVLLDKLEEKMKGTPVEGVIGDLFAGTPYSYSCKIHIY